MASYNTRPPTLYRYRVPVKDHDRPNFLFSSDIPYKISTCVAELHLYSGGYTSRFIDLAKYIEFFDLTLELNALLLRNNTLMPSELIQHSHIFVAKAKAPLGVDTGMVRSVSRFPQVWKSILSMQKANETFVVSFRLFLDVFAVDLADLTDIRIQFHANDTFASLLSSDMSLSGQIKTYVSQKLLQELKSNSDISIHITDSSTILQDSPPNETIAQVQSMYGSPTRDSLDFANTSLDESDTSCVIEKQLVFYDDDDFENTDDDMKLLYSDESGKCQSNEEYESDINSPTSAINQRSPSNMPPVSKLTNILDDGISTLSILETNSRTAPVLSPQRNHKLRQQLASPIPTSPTGKFTTPLFSSAPGDGHAFEESKQARGELDEESSACMERFQESIPCQERDRDSHIENTFELRSRSLSSHGKSTSPGQQDEETNSSFDDFCRDLSHQTPGYQNNTSSLTSSPSKRETRKNSSGSRIDTSSLKHKASLAFVDHDDSYGLKFAFRDSSSSVPEYIKENKKFKFIKVGKVQKFVHMFEEHREPPSNSSSRVGTRPGSPAKLID
ncbi:hypothetical protein JCM33374_g3077 [Metschnikowia sp. JCM 33374]|nr:hypothetical protein JCM33374_g3077 [Metschnikowia sp. JCM 33374]